MEEKKKYYRTCPTCNKTLEYGNKKNRNRFEKINKSCLSCASKEVHKRPETILREGILGKILSEKYSGKGNPFYGKKHSEETIKKLIEYHKTRDKSVYQTIEFKEKSRRPGKLNGMYGRSYYDVWVEKYGQKEANKRMSIHGKKISQRVSGKNNPMYGKPSPKGSGNGWSGWYKGWFFRSLKELSYMINVIEKNHYKWESAETGKFRIKYIDYNGRERTYNPDFLINDKILIEVKPIRLMGTPSNVIKKEAAIKFCKENNFEYRMVDVKILDINKIIKLFSEKIIKFNKKISKSNLLEYK